MAKDGEVVVQVTMARATDEDIRAVREFLDYMAEQSDTDMKDPFGLIQRYEEAAASFERVVFGYEILRDNVCDPTFSHLAYKEEIGLALDAAAQVPDLVAVLQEWVAALGVHPDHAYAPAIRDRLQRSRAAIAAATP